MNHSLFFLPLLLFSSHAFLKEGLSHQCRPISDVACSERALVCPPGYIDGCLSEETDNHECVLKNDGPSCELVMKLECPVNFQDGCRTGQTETHECVPVKGPSCEQAYQFSCPMAFEDSCSSN
jgi:hypothetical protein